MKSGERISNDYVLKRLLGKGGMGEVWLADELVLERKVAIKFFNNASWCETNPTDRFLREAKVMALVSSPHIVTVHAISSEKKKIPYLVMEWVNGESLYQRLLSEEIIEPRTAAHVAYQIALALEAAHQSGVVHRDLKPENVLLTSLAGDPWFVKVVDFGLARSYQSEHSDVGGITTATVVLGTPAYMSPEQAMGKDLGPRSDLYSLGVLLYQMLSGKLPIDADSAHEFLVAHQIKHPIPIQEQPGCEHLPEPLVQLVAKLLEKQEESRPASASVVARYLRAVDLEFHQASTPSFVAIPKSDNYDPAPTYAFAPTHDSGRVSIHIPASEPPKFSSYDPETSALSAKGLKSGRMLGRDEEMNQLFEHLGHVRLQGGSRCVVVRGPSGSGVSRLLMQFLARTRRQHPDNLMMRLYPWSGLIDLPGRPLSHLFTRAAKLTPEMSSSEIRKTFRSALLRIAGPQLEDTRALRRQQISRASYALGHLVGATKRTGAVEHGPDPKRLLSDIKTFGSRFLQNTFGKECVVIVIDHAERLNPITLTLLESWLQRLQPGRWLFLLGANEDAPAKSPLNRGNHVGAHVVRLNPLGLDHMEQIAAKYSETGGLKPDDLSAWINESAGNPGALHRRFLEARLGATLPEYFSQDERFELQILQVAAASGTSISIQGMKDLAGEDGVRVLEQWAAHGLLIQTQLHDLAERGYVFNSGRYHRDLVKAKASPFQKSLHQHLLRNLSHRMSPDSLASIPRILGHQVGIGDLDNSLQTAAQVAEHALLMGALPESIQTAKRVYQTLKKRTERRWLNNPEIMLFVRAVLCLGKSLVLNSKTNEAHDVFENAEDVLRQTASPFVALPRATVLAEHARSAHSDTIASKLYQSALDLLEPDAPPPSSEHALLISKICRELGLLHIREGDTVTARTLLLQAQKAATQTPEVTNKMNVLRTRAELEKRRGKYHGALELYSQILEEAEKTHDRQLSARTRMELGAVLGRLGKFEEGLEHLDLAGQEFEDLEDPVFQCKVELEKASILISRPDTWAARRLLECMSLDPMLNPGIEARRLQLLAYVTLLLQDRDLSSNYAKQSIELAKIVGDQATELRAKLTLTHIISRTPEQALRASRTLTDIVSKQKEIEDWEGLAHTYAYAARAAAQGRIKGAGPTTAKEMLKKAEKLYKRVGYLAEIRRLEELERQLGI